MQFGNTARGTDYLQRLTAFMDEHVYPAEATYYAQLKRGELPWNVPPVMEELKAKARAAGLWNLFLPEEEWGAGLSNAEYAPLAEVMGRSLIAPEIFNCNAPDTGNMEVLVKYGTPEQQERWLKPLLQGRIRSAFCMTEPGVASSDATNMQATAVEDGNEVVLNGRKWWSTGIGHPDCQVLVFMGLSLPDAPKHARHSMVLVPIDAPGVKIERMLTVFGKLDEPYGHGEVSFTNVRMPKENVILGLGRGFEIAQGRLGPGRIHHCMRAIGVAERALDLMIDRAQSRVTFGEPVANRANIMDWVAESRIEIEMARLLTLKAAHMMDTVGNKVARTEIAAIKVAAPAVALKVIDHAIQVHGGGGVSDDFPLALWYAHMRTLRLADGPDEVHKMTIARREYRRRDPNWGRQK